MTRWICALLVLTAVLPLPAHAQQVDVLALSPDMETPDAGRPCLQLTEPTFVTLHLMILNPSGGGVGSWRCGEIDVTNAITPKFSLVAGLDITTDRQTHVVVGYGDEALRPNSFGAVHLADLKFMKMEMTEPTVVRFTGAFDGSGFTYTGVGPDRAPRPLQLVSNEVTDLVYFVDETCTATSSDRTSWGELKALYR